MNGGVMKRKGLCVRCLKRLKRWALLGPWLLLLCCLSCEQIDTTYSIITAYYVCSNVSIVPELYTALHNPGQFCTIKNENGKFLFNGVARLNVSATDRYALGLNGLIVGLPNIPEPGATVSVITCYDLCCRSCYEDRTITRQLSVDTDKGLATCGKCGRTYNLNDQGIVCKGEAGKALYRYRVSYTPYTLVVNNR